MITELSIACFVLGLGFLVFEPPRKNRFDLKIKLSAKTGKAVARGFPLDLLALPVPTSRKKAEADGSKILAGINAVLSAQGVAAEAVSVTTGPATWTAEVECGASTKLKAVTGLIPDIAFRIGYPNIRALGARRGVSTLGLEITRGDLTRVTLRELLASREYLDAKGDLVVPLGIDATTGKPLIADFSQAPHVLLAGTTGSGKSVTLNALILSLAYRYGPKEVQFVMIDPKYVELIDYAGLDHVDGDIITDMAVAEKKLAELAAEMDRRYQYLARHKVKHVSKLKDPYRLPRVIAIFEEYADANESEYGKKIESHVKRLGAKARAAGIHLLIVTQRPTADCLPSSVKANLGDRICGRLLDRVGSQVALDQPGAEGLNGNGDMLYFKNGNITRFQAPFIDDDEIKKALKFLRHGKRTQSVRTGYLSISLDEETGALSGVVLTGAWKGKKLDELSRLELWGLQAEVFPCSDSRRLLDRYMSYKDIEQPPLDEKNRLLFSLDYGFTRSELKKSWRRMMQAYHPDRYGDGSVAGEINAAYQAMIKNG